jgi:hypothetical protein
MSQILTGAGPGKHGVFPNKRLPQTLNTEVEVEYVNHYSYANIARGETVPIKLADEHGPW